MSFAAIGVSVASAAISAGASAAYANNGPDSPNLGAASQKLSNANAEMLPLRRQLEAAAAQGTQITIPDYPAYEHAVEGYYINANSEWDGKKELFGWMTGIPGLGMFEKDGQVFVPKSEFEPGGKLEGKIPQSKLKTKMVKVPAGPRTFDFRGLGQADAAAAVAKATAEAQLALQQKYGVAFAQSNAEQQKLADPEGFAARAKMNELIQGQIEHTPDRTIAQTLDRQVGDQLAAGSGLTAESQAMLDEAVRQAGSDRGGLNVPADFADPLTTGFAGEARNMAGIGKAGGWLASGLTPQDADYRTEQQNLANLSALVNGQTPVSQFSGLNAPGPTPAVNYAGPQLANNAHAGATNAINQYNAEAQNAQQQVNPWMAGLSGLLSAGNAWASNRKPQP